MSTGDWIGLAVIGLILFAVFVGKFIKRGMG